jgi:hypothetical protein
MEPTLKAPGKQRLKLKYDNLLSILLKFCFQIILAPLQRGVAGHRAVYVRAEGFGRHHGRAVQVDTIQTTLQAPGTKRLKLGYDEPLSTFAFKSNLRRYMMNRVRAIQRDTIDAAIAREIELAPIDNNTPGTRRRTTAGFMFMST